MNKNIFETIEESKLNLFTATVCPKCMLVKFALESAGVLEKVNIINLDEYPDVREWLKNNDESKNLQGLPILESGGQFINNQQAIISTVVDV